ncbi:MAG: DNA-binding transcriptional regulator [Pirellulales bacterium]
MSRVLLLIDARCSVGAGILRGVNSYAHTNELWTIDLCLADRDPVEWLNHNKGNGIIAQVASCELHESLRAYRLPILDVAGAYPPGDIPGVVADEVAIGELAAEHLLLRQFRHFGYFGGVGPYWSQMRCQSFAHAIEGTGFTCQVLQLPLDSQRVRAAPHTGSAEQALTAWVRQIPKPIGVMCDNDLHGWNLVKVCRSEGIAVPDEVAILGVDNDQLLCDLTAPTLSSMELDAFGVGLVAARMLDQWMRGRRPTSRVTRIKPRGVVSRGSTNVVATSDSDVSRAVRMIRQQACEGIQVDDVLETMPFSRRVFERRFKEILGHTPYQEILSVRFRRVVELLTETELSIAEIAARSGFGYPEDLSRSFKRRYGMPAQKYREQHSIIPLTNRRPEISATGR